MNFKKLLTALLIAALSIISINTESIVLPKQIEAETIKQDAIVENIPVSKNSMIMRTSDTPALLKPRLEGMSPSKKRKYKPVSEAADIARERLRNHEAYISAYVKSDNSNAVEVFEQFEEELLKETSRGDEGDYMHWDINREYPSYNSRIIKEGKKRYYYYNFKIEYWYFTTLEQKIQVDNKVKEIIAGFGFTEQTTEYEKVKAVYDYVCSNVKYSENLDKDIVYTAWSALFQKEAVCQGYAQLMYRMLKEAGISVRLIPGYGKGMDIMHGWNIVKIGDCYYNLDSTWDAEYKTAGKEYAYFLKSDNFLYHTRLSDYNTDIFYSEYPMAEGDYGSGMATLSAKSRKAAFRVIIPKFKKISRNKIKLVRVADAKKYQIRYAADKKMKKSAKSAFTKKNSYKLKKLKKDKKYYIKFRAYKYIDGKKIYTQWSKVKKVKK